MIVNFKQMHNTTFCAEVAVPMVKKPLMPDGAYVA
jgi:hypothetical protein